MLMLLVQNKFLKSSISVMDYSANYLSSAVIYNNVSEWKAVSLVEWGDLNAIAVTVGTAIFSLCYLSYRTYTHGSIITGTIWLKCTTNRSRMVIQMEKAIQSNWMVSFKVHVIRVQSANRTGVVPGSQWEQKHAVQITAALNAFICMVFGDGVCTYRQIIRVCS